MSMSRAQYFGRRNREDRHRRDLIHWMVQKDSFELLVLETM